MNLLRLKRTQRTVLILSHCLGFIFLGAFFLVYNLSAVLRDIC